MAVRADEVITAAVLTASMFASAIRTPRCFL